MYSFQFTVFHCDEYVLYYNAKNGTHVVRVDPVMLQEISKLLDVKPTLMHMYCNAH